GGAVRDFWGVGICDYFSGLLRFCGPLGVGRRLSWIQDEPSVPANCSYPRRTQRLQRDKASPCESPRRVTKVGTLRMVQGGSFSGILRFPQIRRYKPCL